MNDINIPSELTEMIKHRRVIPFLGAGFSAALKLPEWDKLLSSVAGEIEGCMPYDEVKKCCNGDPLQIAEYYLILCDHSIGPIRHAISRSLQSTSSPLESGAHVELINLGAPHIYTTNYDELIEGAYRQLEQPVEVVALPKHVATASGNRTQVVKYHGDLRHESTLVLTESSYYARLDFESPMDLKFRSDLLGKSVLFIGYSFRDINIRIIWFKLMRMMKDIPQGDRPSSYIVRFGRNPVLEKLYEEVGIKTIVLDANNEAHTIEDKSRILDDFMFQLAAISSPDGKIPGSDKHQFVTRSLLAQIDGILSEESRIRTVRRGIFTTRKRIGGRLEPLIALLSRRVTPKVYSEDVANCALRLIHYDAAPYIMPALAMLAGKHAASYGAHTFVTAIVARSMASSESRSLLLKKDAPWNLYWGAKLTDTECEPILGMFESELQYQDQLSENDDLAYVVDPICRIANGEIFSGNDSLTTRAHDLLNEAIKRYPSIASYVPKPKSAPEVDDIAQEILSAQRTARAEFEKMIADQA
jgi:hypothetical protein